MGAPTITLDDSLRTVIRLGRNRARLSQAAAARKAGISEIWWSQLETGLRDVTTMDNLVNMLESINVPIRVLRKAGHLDVAQEMQQRYDWFGGDALENI